MKTVLIRWLLAALNSRWLNDSPCEYGFIGNVDAFSLEHLRSEESQRPGITVATILRETEAFKSCPMRGGIGMMVEEDGVWRGGDVWDIQELRQALRPANKDTCK